MKAKLLVLLAAVLMSVAPVEAQGINTPMLVEPGNPVVAGTSVTVKPYPQKIEGHETRLAWKVIYWPITNMGPIEGPSPTQTNVERPHCTHRGHCTFTVPLNACESDQCRPVLAIIQTYNPAVPWNVYRHVACVEVIHPNDPSIVSSNAGWNCGLRDDSGNNGGGGTPPPPTPTPTPTPGGGGVGGRSEPPEEEPVETVSLDFPHFANGAGVVSDLVLVNTADYVVPFAIRFSGEDGNPIAPELLVDLTEDLEVVEDGDLAGQLGMDPMGELTISTHGRGELVSGSLQVAADGPIGGVLRFDLPGIGVAGVGASQPITTGVFPARRQGGLSTAVAIHNIESRAIEVVCRLMKEGVVLEVMTLPLAANGQTAQFIEEMFLDTDTSDFVGSVRCSARAWRGMFTAIAVELDAGNQIFNTLPVVPVQR